MRKQKDGTPRSIGVRVKDPLPYVKIIDADTRVRSNNNCGGFDYEFLPRPGFLQREEDYE